MRYLFFNFGLSVLVFIANLQWQVFSFLAPFGSPREKLLLNFFERVHLCDFPVLRLINPAIIYKYLTWINENEPDNEELSLQKEKLQELRYKPLISIITPVFNTPETILLKTIESVMSQTYQNWELCIANGSPNSRQINNILVNYSRDERVRVINLEKNLGIAGNSNAAIDLACGEFIAFLDHDDLLAPFALFEIVTALNQYQEIDLLYSDEDFISSNGEVRYNPNFKPAYSPDFLRSGNYMAHFLVIRKSVGNRVGWLREGFEGAQDFDLILRITEVSRAIAHIPKILYHWRAIPGSAAYSAREKTYTVEAGKKALRDHLKRIDFRGDILNGPFSNTYQVISKMLENPLVSIIIPNRDHALDLEKCIKSILNKSKYRNFEIIIVENGSQDQRTIDFYEKIISCETNRVRIVEYGKRFNFSMVNNYGADCASGDFLLFLNNDTEVISSFWLERMLEHVVRRSTGAVGAKLYFSNGRVQHAGIIFGEEGVALHSHYNYRNNSSGYFGRLNLIQNYSALTAACLMLRKNVFEEVGCFSAEYPLAYGDVDLCMKLREKNYLLVWTPYAELYHQESKTRGYEDTNEKRIRFDREFKFFVQKWSHKLNQGDIYYNPNLESKSQLFQINTTKVTTKTRVVQQREIVNIRRECDCEFIN